MYEYIREVYINPVTSSLAGKDSRDCLLIMLADRSREIMFKVAKFGCLAIKRREKWINQDKH